MFSIGHISDLHATPVRVERASQLLNKRFLGWVSWNLHRSKVYRPDVFAALVDDLRAAAPDQVVVTGDLTNVALESEFVAAREWLERIGGAEHVSVVPGNHDAYVRVPRAAAWDQWWEYMASDPVRGERPEIGGAAADPVASFPTLRIRGPAAIVGICTATPTPPFVASGKVGRAQLERLEGALTALADSDLCRIALIHHPPMESSVARRRALIDAEALRAVLRRTGADLILHGHMHRTSIDRVAGPRGPIPVVGVRSSSYLGGKPHKRAQYHLYAIEPGGPDGARFRITLRVRGYDPATGGFGTEETQVF
jgi:3',5'-cyclic AMP phosphodiesterase CpdA